MKKICKTCKEEKSKEDFPLHGYVRKSDGASSRRSVCKECYKIVVAKNHVKKYKQKNKHDRDLVRCEICGYEATLLTSHIHFKHKISMEEYKKKYNTPISSPFTQEMKDNRKETSPTSKLYWIKKGYTEEEAVSIVSKRQSTFSLEKCVERDGEKNGRKRWEERQELWQKSLLNNTEEFIDDMNERKNPWKEEFWERDSWKEDYASRVKKGNGVVPKLLLECFDVKDLIKMLPTIVTYEKLRQYLKIKGLRIAFKITEQNEEHIYREMMKEYSFELPKNSKSFGQKCYYNGIMFRSLGEAEIAKFLDKEGVYFLYERRYPIKETRYLYDFYLPKYDLYVEYYGLSLYGPYKERMEKKKKELLDNNIKCVFSDDVEKLKEYLKEEINE